MSNGIFISFLSAYFLSKYAMTFLFTISRCRRLLYTIKENHTSSPFFVFAISRNERGFIPPIDFVRRSSPLHSKYSSAPCFLHTFPASAATFLYTPKFLLGTVSTNPSTYTPFMLLLFIH